MFCFLTYLCLALCFALLTCSQSKVSNVITLYRSVSLEGNELEQFYKFENLTKSYGDYLTSGDECIASTRKYDSNCLNNLTNWRSTRFPMKQLWERKVVTFTLQNKQTVNRVAKDCNYGVTIGSMLHDTKKGFIVELLIEQSECASKTKILGGASFYATAKNDMFLVTCGTDDLFNNFYRVKCYIPTFISSFKFETSCMNISLSILYEHFDGFNTDDSTEFRSSSNVYTLHVPLINETQYCYSHTNRIKNKSGATKFLDWGDVDAILRDKSHTNSLGIWVRSDLKADSYHYMISDGGKHLTKSEFFECTKTNYIHITGESHQRFTWDYLAYEYFEAKHKYLDDLKPLHNDASLQYFDLHTLFFIPNVVKYINKIACPLSNSTATHVIQFGSWDLRAASVRYIMRNHNFIPAIINAIRNLIEKKGCYTKVRIVLVLPMPYPNCPYTDYDCSRFKGMGRVTNPSIDAISQYLIQVLSKLQSKQIDIVDTRSILSSNLTAHECGSHFLCRDKDKKWRETVSGDAFVATSIHAACH